MLRNMELKTWFISFDALKMSNESGNHALAQALDQALVQSIVLEKHTGRRAR